MEVPIRITEVWRCDSEEEAQAMIERKSHEGNGDITKKLVEYRTKSLKGVVVDEAYRVTIQFDYNKLFENAEFYVEPRDDDEDYE